MLAAAAERTGEDSLDLDGLERLIDLGVSLRIEQALCVARGRADSRCHADCPTRQLRAALPRLHHGRAVRRPRSRARTATTAHLMNNKPAREG
jgi:hypothetical protein